MDVTVLDIINGAMEEVGVKEADEALSASDSQLGLRRLNMMLSHYSGGSLAVRGITLENFTLVTNQYSYTIGVGGNMNTAKPYRVEYAYVRDDDSDYPLAIMTREKYDLIQEKSGSAGRPDRLCFDPYLTQQATHTGYILLYPKPDAAYTLYLGMLKSITHFDDLDTVITFEDIYFEFLMYQLAKRLWRPYHNGGELIPVDILSAATAAEKKVENMNSRIPVVVVDVPGDSGIGTYNIYNDTY